MLAPLFRRHPFAGAHWRAVLLAAIALATLAGCASASARTTSTIAPTPTYPLGGKFATATAQAWTPTLPPDAATHMPVPGAQFKWVAAKLPSGFGFDYHSSWLDVSTDNGATAYSCSQSSPSQAIQTIVTHDAGVTWSRVASVNQPWDGCMSLAADALNPRIAVMTNGNGAYALTLNGGQSWRSGTSAILSSVARLATVGSRTYALVYGGSSSPRLMLRRGRSLLLARCLSAKGQPDYSGVLAESPQWWPAGRDAARLYRRDDPLALEQWRRELDTR